ncbi:uncharacterized protein LOC124444618 isoform X2 [Xenia sp. Carnegie-2017]|uniref:uncharacterized protein LOC124444618 isoform X2 n=1 Tax=Xenia sp. Carnegie-2017 TaxID=2897299 RepID=UPI001F03881D|nr:uncharacterized protein LOC124444618 isoform X2 [Xenia sp. Carnegie-2017]
MWFYFMSHVAYHLTRWFPKDDRQRIRITLVLLSLIFIVPQVYVLMLDKTTRYCDQPLLEIAVASLIFTFGMIAFTILFTMMEPVPWQLKIAFHFFGFASFLMGLVQFGSTMSSNDCWFNTPELYSLSLSFSIIAILTTVFLLMMLPFWLINYFFPHSVLSRKERRGMCYEPCLK